MASAIPHLELIFKYAMSFPPIYEISFQISSHSCSSNNEKTLGETQTLHDGCSKAEPKIFATLQTPFLGAPDGPNLISWRWSLPSSTDPVW